VARNMYGATSADFTLTSGGRVVPGATLTIWSARTGGTQITDLLDKDSVATTTVTSDADGSIVYYGPNNDKTVHWADSGVGSRIAIRPVDITGDPPVLSIGTVGTGAAAASLTGTSEAPVLNLTLPTAGANGVNTAAIQDGAVTVAKLAGDARRSPTLISRNSDFSGWTAESGCTLSRTGAALTGTATSGDIYLAAPPVSVTAGQVYEATVYIKANKKTDSALVRVYWLDSNGSQISTPSTPTQAPDATGYKKFSLAETAPANAVSAVLRIICYAPPAGAAYTVALDVPEGIEPLISATRPAGTNLLNPDQIVVGKEVYGDGTFPDQAASAISGYVPIPPGARHISISGLTSYSAGMDRYVRFYSAPGVVVGGSQASIPTASSSAIYSVPAGAWAVAFSIYQRKTSGETIDLTSVQVEVGADPSSFVAFSPALSQVAGRPVAAHRPVTTGMSMLCFGDSITETATVSDDGSSYTEGTRDNWPARTAARLGLRLWNYAKSGGNICDSASPESVRQLASVQISTAIANSRPADIIVYAFGTNTIPALGDYATAMGKATLNDLDRTKAYEALRWAFWTLRVAYPNAACFAGLPIQRADRDVVDDPVREAIIKMAGRYGFTLVDGAQDSGIVRELETWGSAGADLYDGLHTGVGGITKLAHLYSARILAAFEG